jgi:vacuolar-type H+-ATPase subunit E/Vma4
MNDDQSEPLQRLLQQITRHQEESCQQILQEAHAQADAWIASAKTEAKRRLSIAKKAEKERLAEAQATLKARQATELRQQQLRQTQAMLEQGWSLLLESVTRHWGHPEQRAIWLSTLAQRAEQLFAREPLPGRSRPDRRSLHRLSGGLAGWQFARHDGQSAGVVRPAVGPTGEG